MKIEDIKLIAKKKRVNPEKLSKKDLIRAIQKAEGNFDCFGKADKNCSQISCLWRVDCLQKNF